MNGTLVTIRGPRCHGTRTLRMPRRTAAGISRAVYALSRELGGPDSDTWDTAAEVDAHASVENLFRTVDLPRWLQSCALSGELLAYHEGANGHDEEWELIVQTVELPDEDALPVLPTLL